MIYAGIGARNTPTNIASMMKIIGMCFAIKGYTLNTGAAKGADQAFAEGAISVGGKVNLFLPWPTYEKDWWSKFAKVNIFVFNQKNKKAIDSVFQYHPAAGNLSRSVIALHARNYLIVRPSKLVICYTKNGDIIGGTGQAMRIALARKIETLNLGKTEHRKKIHQMIKKMLRW